VLFAQAERAALEGDLRSLPLFAVLALFFFPSIAHLYLLLFQ
jgi:hypothetical protein